MNTKKVKRLRKEIGYHPSQPRKYAYIGTKKMTDKGVVTFNSIEIAPGDKRSLYQEMKKELR